jgi:hypothetical protein
LRNTAYDPDDQRESAGPMAEIAPFDLYPAPQNCDIQLRTRAAAGVQNLQIGNSRGDALCHQTRVGKSATCGSWRFIGYSTYRRAVRFLPEVIGLVLQAL